LIQTKPASNTITADVRHTNNTYIRRPQSWHKRHTVYQRQKYITQMILPVYQINWLLTQ